MEANVGQIVGIGLSVGLPLAGGVVGILRWSICRNIAEMDKKLTTALERIDTLYQKHDDLRRDTISRTDCSTCRRECQERVVLSNQAMQVWMQRLEDKLERLVMMVANLHNGQGGVQNGLK